MAGKGKQPALMLYTGDWLKDPELSECEPSTRGIWIDWVCCLKEKMAAGREPVLSATPKALARLARCSAEEALEALLDLHRTGTADVTFPLHRYDVVTVSNTKVTDEVTLVSRRLKREHRAIVGNAERQKRYRDNAAESQASNAKVTPPLSASSSVSSSSPKKEKKKDSCTTRSQGGADALPDLEDEDVATWFHVVRGKGKRDESRVRIDPESGDEQWAVLHSDIDGADVAYPDVEIADELAKMSYWLKSNRTKRKTHGGVPRFINTWLTNAQNRPARRDPPPKDPSTWRQAAMRESKAKEKARNGKRSKAMTDKRNCQILTPERAEELGLESRLVWEIDPGWGEGEPWLERHPDLIREADDD